jgi:hypothetical protein
MKAKIGTIADLNVFVNGDSPFHVWVERVEGGVQKDPTGLALEPAEAIVLAELLLKAARTPVELSNMPERTRQLAGLVQAANPDSAVLEQHS